MNTGQAHRRPWFNVTDEPSTREENDQAGADRSVARERCHHSYVYPHIRSLLPGSGKLSILDAGCGSGFIAGRLDSLGHKVVGIDSSPQDITLARGAYPEIRFEVAPVYDELVQLMPPGGWDLVVSAEVIEHLYSPEAFLRNVHKHIRPGGWLMLTTPYHGYLKNLAISLLSGWDRHHTVDWEGGHVKFFSPRTFSRMLEETGFGRPVFNNAGRIALLWKSMVCRSERQDQ